jgi:hypothetical protein
VGGSAGDDKVEAVLYEAGLILTSTCSAVAGRRCRLHFREVESAFPGGFHRFAPELLPYCKAEKRRCARIRYTATVLWVTPTSPSTTLKEGSHCWSHGPEDRKLPRYFQTSIGPVERANPSHSSDLMPDGYLLGSQDPG